MVLGYGRRAGAGAVLLTVVGLTLPAVALVATAVPVVLRATTSGGSEEPAQASTPTPPLPVAPSSPRRVAPPSPPKTALRVSDAGTPAIDPVPPVGRRVAGSLLLGGGAARDGGFGLLGGTIAAPLGSGTLQVDGLGGGGVRGAFAGGAVQFLMGDATASAAGLYLSGSSLPNADVLRAGATGILNIGRFAAIGTLGYENVAGRPGFFDMVDVVYRPTDSLSLSLGHRRVDGRDLAAAGVSADVAGGVTIVGEGRIGPGSPGHDVEVAGLLGLRLALGEGGPNRWATLPSRLLDDVLTPPRR